MLQPKSRNSIEGNSSDHTETLLSEESDSGSEFVARIATKTKSDKAIEAMEEESKDERKPLVNRVN